MTRMALPGMAPVGFLALCVLPPLLAVFDKDVRKLLFQILLKPILLICVFCILWFLYLYGFLLLDWLTIKFVLMVDRHQVREMAEAGLFIKYADRVWVHFSHHYLYIAVTQAAPWFCALMALITEWKLIARFRGKRPLKSIPRSTPDTTGCSVMTLPRMALLVAMALLPTCLTSSLWAQSQDEMNDEAYAKFQKADAKLNATYQEILSLYDDNPGFLRSLRNAQRKWIEFRDAQVQSHFLSEGLHGSFRPMVYRMMLERLTVERTGQLQAWLDGVPQGDVSSETVKTKEELDKARKAKAPPVSPSPDQEDSETLFPAVQPSVCSLHLKP